jgi:hypothetical protein
MELLIPARNVIHNAKVHARLVELSRPEWLLRRFRARQITVESMTPAEREDVQELIVTQCEKGKNTP